MKKFGTALAAALWMAAPEAVADLQVNINNRSCALLTVELPDAEGCGPQSIACVIEARSGTTKLWVRQTSNDDFIKVVARGECAARNMVVGGSCTIKIKKVISFRPATAGDPRPYNNSLIQSTVAETGPATFVAIDLLAGMCDTDAGQRKCELACKGGDQQ